GGAHLLDLWALEPRPALTDPLHGRGELERVRLLTPGAGALPPLLRRLLRLVSRGDQAAGLRGRGGRARDRGRGAGAASEAAASGDAARDRGDLVELARPRDAADRGPVARGGRR